MIISTCNEVTIYIKYHQVQLEWIIMYSSEENFLILRIPTLPKQKKLASENYLLVVACV
jgi:hypothetical protein